MPRLNNNHNKESEVSLRKKILAWLVFAIFVILTFSLVFFFFLNTGWFPCDERGTCMSDRAVAVIAVLLILIHSALAAYIHSRLKKR